MADSKQTVNVSTDKNVTVNVDNRGNNSRVSEQAVVRGEKTVSTNDSAISQKASTNSKRVDTGNFDDKPVDVASMSRKLLSEMSKAFQVNTDPVYDNLKKSVENLDKAFEQSIEKIKSEAEKRNKQEQEEARKAAEEKRKQLLSEAEKESAKATREAVSALEEYDKILDNKTSVLSDTARAGVASAYHATEIGGLNKASATLAMGAINPALGSLAQMVLSKDGIGPYITSVFSSMFSFAKKEANKTLKNMEIEDRVTKALHNSAINVEKLLKKTEDLKNIDVKELLRGTSKNKKSIFGEDSVAKSDQVVVQEKQQGMFAKFTNSISNMFQSLLPVKKTGAEIAHEKTYSDMFGRKIATKDVSEKTRSDSWKEIFALFKKGLVSTLGLVALYFSGDQFKAWLKDFITTPFKNLATSIKDGTFSFENNWKDILKALGIVFVGVKGILGNLSTLSAVVKLVMKGSKLIGAATFAGLTAYHAYEFKKAMDANDSLGMLNHGVLGVTDALATVIPQFRAYALLIEAVNGLLQWYLNRKLEEEKRKHEEAVNKSLEGARSDATEMKELTKATKKDISVEEFADMKRRKLTKEQMIEELKKKDTAILSDAQLESAMKAYDHGILLNKYQQMAYKKFGSEGLQGVDALEALYRSGKVRGEERNLLKQVIDDEIAIRSGEVSARDYFDRPVVAAEIKQTSALNLNQTPQDIVNNVTGQVSNYVPQVQVPTAAITAEMVKTSSENTQVISDKFCTVENLLIELNKSINLVNTTIQTKKSPSAGGIPSTSTTIAATGR